MQSIILICSFDDVVFLCYLVNEFWLVDSFDLECYILLCSFMECFSGFFVYVLCIMEVVSGFILFVGLLCFFQIVDRLIIVYFIYQDFYMVGGYFFVGFEFIF